MKEFSRAIWALALLCLVFFLAYALLVYVAVPVVSFIALLALSGWGTVVAVFSIKSYNKRVPGLPGETRLAYELRMRRVTHPDADEKDTLAALVDTGHWALVSHLVTLAILLMFLMSASNRVPPVNYAGFLALILVLVAIARTVQAVSNIDANKLKTPLASSASRLIGLGHMALTGVLLATYALGVLALKAGIV